MIAVLVLVGGTIGYLSADRILRARQAHPPNARVAHENDANPVAAAPKSLPPNSPLEAIADADDTASGPGASVAIADSAPEHESLSVREFSLPTRSVEGREIEVVEMGSGENTTFIMSAIHGDERPCPTVARQLIEYLKKNPRELDGRKVWIMPIANPDGWLRGTRQNANGVDLNRNFPLNWSPACDNKRYFPGDAAASEPETQAYMQFLKEHRPDKIISMHSPLRMMCPTGSGIPLAREMALYNDYRVDISVGYPTPGAMGDYCGLEDGLGLAIVTLELPASDGMQAWLDNKDALLHAIAFSSP